MLYIMNLEKNLVKSLMDSKTQLAQEVFTKLFKEFLLIHNQSQDLLWITKSYLLGLNGIIYSSLLLKPGCRKKLYEKRNSNSNKIYLAESLECLEEDFIKIITSYGEFDKNNFCKAYNYIINDAINYIHNNISRDLSLKSVASKIHISKSYLSYLFSTSVGSSFSDYVNKSRVEKSKFLLEKNNYSILEVALECGFTSQSYFCSVFKKYENMTPKEYQNYYK